MQTALRNRNLLLFLCIFLWSIGAQAVPSKMSYMLNDYQRLEVHYDSDGEYGSVKILLFRKDQTNPISLSLEEPKDQTGKSLIDGKSRRLVFPAPIQDVDRKSLPDWMALDHDSAVSLSLTQRGILIIRNESERGNFVQAFPVLPQAAQGVDVAPRPYLFRDEPRVQRYPYRHYSAAFVESAGHSNAPEANLLMSILDSDGNGDVLALGTVILKQDGRLQNQNSEFTDFFDLGRRYEFQPSDMPGFMNILVDGKVWGRPVTYTDVKWQTRWPLNQDHSQDSTLSPEQLEKIAANQRRARIAVLERELLPTRHLYHQFITRIESGVPEFERDEAERVEQEFEKDEPRLKQEMEFAVRLLQRSGIAQDLANEKETISRYLIKDFPSSSSDVRLLALSVRTENKRSTSKMMTWIFSIDASTHQILGQYRIPKTHSLRNLTVLPSGQVYLKNRTIIYLTPNARANRCADVFRK